MLGKAVMMILESLQDDAAEAEWFDVTEPPSHLAFDHKMILRKAFEHLLKFDETRNTGMLTRSRRLRSTLSHLGSTLSYL